MFSLSPEQLATTAKELAKSIDNKLATLEMGVNAVDIGLREILRLTLNQLAVFHVVMTDDQKMRLLNLIFNYSHPSKTVASERCDVIVACIADLTSSQLQKLQRLFIDKIKLKYKITAAEMHALISMLRILNPVDQRNFFKELITVLKTAYSKNAIVLQKQDAIKNLFLIFENFLPQFPEFRTEIINVLNPITPGAAKRELYFHEALFLAKLYRDAEKIGMLTEETMTIRNLLDDAIESKLTHNKNKSDSLDSYLLCEIVCTAGLPIPKKIQDQIVIEIEYIKKFQRLAHHFLMHFVPYISMEEHLPFLVNQLINDIQSPLSLAGALNLSALGGLNCYDAIDLLFTLHHEHNIMSNHPELIENLKLALIKQLNYSTVYMETIRSTIQLFQKHHISLPEKTYTHLIECCIACISDKSRGTEKSLIAVNLLEQIGHSDVIMRLYELSQNLLSNENFLDPDPVRMLLLRAIVRLSTHSILKNKLSDLPTNISLSYLEWPSLPRGLTPKETTVAPEIPAHPKMEFKEQKKLEPLERPAFFSAASSSSSSSSTSSSPPKDSEKERKKNL